MGLGTALFGLILGCKGPPAEPVDSGSVIDTEWVDDTGQPLVLESITLSPTQLVVDPGAQWQMRAYGHYADGSVAPLSLEMSSSSEAVSAQGLQLSAQSQGAATLSVTLDGVSASAEVLVQSTPELRVQVVGHGSGEVLPGMRVVLDGERLITDEQGRVSFTPSSGQALSLTAFGADSAWIPATVLGVVSRDLVLPLRHVSELAPPPDGLAGEVDFGGLDKADPDQQQLALCGVALPGSPLLLRELDLLTSSREVSFFGASAQVPQNIAVQRHDPSFYVPGGGALWTLAGTFPITELSAGVDTLGQAMALLEAWTPTMRYELREGQLAPQELTLAPELPLSASVAVTLPSALPQGVSAGESVLVLLFGESADGWVLQGLASGVGTVDVVYADLGLPMVAMGWLEAGGAGAGSGRALSLGPVEGGWATLDPWVQPPRDLAVAASDGGFSVDTDPEAVMVWAQVETGSGELRDLYFPSGQVQGLLGQDLPLNVGRTQWELLSVHALQGSYQALLASGDLQSQWRREQVRASGGLQVEIIAQ